MPSSASLSVAGSGCFSEKNKPVGIIKAWWQEKIPLNWLWFAFSVFIYAVHNILLLTIQPLDSGEFASIAFGRVLTALIVISLFWTAAHVASRASPEKIRSLPWLVPAIIPGFLAIDTLIIIYWNNSLAFALNKIDEQGSLDVSRQLAAGGFKFGAPTFFLILTGAVATFALLIYLTHRLSLLKKITLTPRRASLILLGAWLILFGEKAAGYLWKSRQALRLEHRLYQIHLTPIEPSPGVATYSAAFKEPIVPDTPLTYAKKPDIIYIMIESLRADLLDPAHSPFLCRFRDQECQQITKTWAASNATHLSWFSVFNGQLPNYWVRSNDTGYDTGKLPASPWILLLKKNGYRQEVRGVCDFSYNGMSSTNFGLPHVLDVEVQAPVDSDFYKQPQPDRELEILNQAKKSLAENTDQPHFQFLAFDATHFGYEWHEDFDPPYSEYDPSAMFNAYPSESDIRKVKNRYLNALAWLDHLIEDLVNTLKEQNRYDDALIIITGDHGEEFHEHGSWFHCSTLRPEQTAVPILIKWPDGTEAPPQPSASHLDLLPSLMDHLKIPAEKFAHLPGRSLLQVQEKEPTQMTITSFCGISGISMSWHRKDHTATFRWHNPWSSTLPDQIHLDDITGPNGSLDLDTDQDWTKALHEHFPDAPHRFFTHFDLLPEE